MVTKISAPEYSGEEEPVYVHQTKRKHLYQAAEALLSGFTWSQTAEGPDFWESLYYRLREMAGGEALK